MTLHFLCLGYGNSKPCLLSMPQHSYSIKSKCNCGIPGNYALCFIFDDAAHLLTAAVKWGCAQVLLTKPPPLENGEGRTSEERPGAGAPEGLEDAAAQTQGDTLVDITTIAEGVRVINVPLHSNNPISGIRPSDFSGVARLPLWSEP